jgi:hypothetical protein
MNDWSDGFDRKPPLAESLLETVAYNYKKYKVVYRQRPGRRLHKAA